MNLDLEQRSAPPASLLFLELNEAEGHFLDAFVARGRLPAFAEMLATGARWTTRVPGWDGRAERAWRDISPWIVWPTVYTGLAPAEHRLIGFGQDPSAITGRCTWDLLDAAGIPVGVFGSLMSYPPRSAGAARFYVPEALADDAECFPPQARPVQDFCVFGARHYSESFLRLAFPATRRLLATLRSGVRARTVLRTLLQVPDEWMRGAARSPERAMLQSYMARDAFFRLYRRTRPAFATLHMNHVAYMQHRYWRAAEPQRFSDELSATDRRFFDTPAERDRYERSLAGWIERSFRFSDEVVRECMDALPEGGWLLVASGLGQRPFDPVREIHNPVVRLLRAEELLERVGLAHFRVRHQMNPDLTVDFASEADAERAERELAGFEVRGGRALFVLQRRGRQLFLELDMPRRSEPGERFELRHARLPDFRAPLERYVEEHRTSDQSTAHHKDAGILLAWRKGQRLAPAGRSLPVTAIAPAILRLFGLQPAPWMRDDPGELFQGLAEAPARAAAIGVAP